MFRPDCLRQELGVDDVSPCVICGVHLSATEEKEKEREKGRCGGAGLVVGRLAGLAWVAAALFF